MATAATEYRLSTEETLKDFVRAILTKVEIDPADAAIVADVLVASDLRGIESHGVARLESYYVNRLRRGQIEAHPTIETVRETGTSISIDAGNGLGHPVAKRTMDKVIAKAQEHGSAFGAVRNSNHYGIAGYYAMMGLEHDLVGMASTNTVRYGAPDVWARLDVRHQPVRLCRSDRRRTGFRAGLCDNDGAARQARGVRPQE